ncbi:putative lipoprotein YfhM [compost metagenome]
MQAGLAVSRNDKDWLGDYGSPVRDQALILALLEENNLASTQLDQRLFQLSDQVAASQWLSTQERNALFLAGRGLLNKPEGKWSARRDSAGELRDLDSAQSGLKLEGPLLASPLTVQNQGSDTLYQQLTLSGYPRYAPAPSSSGMNIRREYLGLNGRTLDIRALKSGDLVLVHLAVTATSRVPDALVVDLLPAGLELENQNLAQSAASLDNASSAVKQWRDSMQNANVVHQEFRDDRYVAALPVDSYGTTHLLYLARAVTPGTYRVPPPQVESMYRPNLQSVGESAGEMVIKGR